MVYTLGSRKRRKNDLSTRRGFASISTSDVEKEALANLFAFFAARFLFSFSLPLLLPLLVIVVLIEPRFVFC